jgi:hypothetical protein
LERVGVNAIELLRDAIARVIHAEEAIEDGDSSYAHAILTGLEADLVSSLAALELEAAA